MWNFPHFKYFSIRGLTQCLGEWQRWGLTQYLGEWQRRGLTQYRGKDSAEVWHSIWGMTTLRIDTVLGEWQRLGIIVWRTGSKKKVHSIVTNNAENWREKICVQKVWKRRGQQIIDHIFGDAIAHLRNLRCDTFQYVNLNYKLKLKIN